jgi:ACS family sodium-dependent inorganic phosphate cotransporter
VAFALQGLSFAGPGLCLIACALLTPHGAAHAPGTTPTSLIVALFSLAFALGAWSRAGLYCNHQVILNALWWSH